MLGWFILAQTQPSRLLLTAKIRVVFGEMRAVFGPVWSVGVIGWLYEGAHRAKLPPEHPKQANLTS